MSNSKFQPVATGNRQVAQREGKPSLAAMIQKMRPEMQRALPKHMDPDRMARIALTTLRQTPKLGECKPESFLGALMTCAQVGLEPGPLGEAYLVPYGREVTFVPGYRGLVKLAWQSGQLNSIAAHVVYEGDAFDYSYGLDPSLTHKPALTNRGKVVAAYAVATFKHGGNAFEIMSIEDIEAIRKRSKASGSGPWVTDWNEMARKTVLKRLAKWLPLSSEFANAVQRDGTVRTDVGVQLDDVKPDWIDGEVDPDPSRVTAAEIAGEASNPVEEQDMAQVSESDAEAEPDAPKVSPAQLKKLRTLLAAWKYTTPAARLEYLQSQFGDQITDERQLDAEVADQFIGWLEQEQAADAEKAAAAEEEPAVESNEGPAEAQAAEQ
ncbi:recombination protein RecT [Rhodococcus sp. OK611]|uniref:recombination protein RecT n=1 Tax=unclassified Rhodococcus (in: high G+C Gram-positive bacteria) TaxID=192944 RepID=UPI000BC92D56|nr:MULTISPECIES: recombination protein RecT [unclassified Rhodococcus (in: high G+C Gram-positive bacteria)]PTR42057.1 recombination protein RecT [Rhodococcus sp. OK611]SNX91496.1 recombination protein RecT [Rhodococcus sp. OK270]